MITVAHRVPRAAAAERWAEAGVDRYEADVQLAGDGRVVVSHFLPFLGVRGWVQHDGWTFRWGPGRDPSLPEVVDALPAGVGVLLDPKETDPSRRAALVDALCAALPERAGLVVSTDHREDLTRYRDAGFTTWRTVKDDAGLRDVLAGGGLPDAGVSIRHSLLDARTVGRLHERVGLVVAWTVNEASRARELVAAGVDGVTTDDPAIATLVKRPDPDDA